MAHDHSTRDQQHGITEVNKAFIIGSIFNVAFVIIEIIVRSSTTSLALLSVAICDEVKCDR